MRFGRPFAVVVTLALACDRGPPDVPAPVNVRDLATGSSVGGEVQLADAAPFAWDSVWVFVPYSVDLPNEPAHPARRAARHGSIRVQDHSNVLVFMRGSEVMGMVEIRRREVDFDLGRHGTGPLARDEAAFVVCRNTTTSTPVLALSAAEARPWIACAVSDSGRALEPMT